MGLQRMGYNWSDFHFIRWDKPASASTLEVKSWHECKSQKEAQLQFVKPEWGEHKPHDQVGHFGSQPQGSQLPQDMIGMDAAHIFLGFWAACLIWQTHNPARQLPREAHDPPQIVATSHRSLLRWVLPHTYQLCLPYLSFSPARLSKWALIMLLLLLPFMSGQGTANRAMTYKHVK